LFDVGATQNDGVTRSEIHGKRRLKEEAWSPNHGRDAAVQGTGD